MKIIEAWNLKQPLEGRTGYVACCGFTARNFFFCPQYVWNARTEMQGQEIVQSERPTPTRKTKCSRLKKLSGFASWVLQRRKKKNKLEKKNIWAPLLKKKTKPIRVLIGRRVSEGQVNTRWGRTKCLMVIQSQHRNSKAVTNRWQLVQHAVTRSGHQRAALHQLRNDRTIALRWKNPLNGLNHNDDPVLNTVTAFVLSGQCFKFGPSTSFSLLNLNQEANLFLPKMHHSHFHRSVPLKALAKTTLVITLQFGFRTKRRIFPTNDNKRKTTKKF